MRTFDSREQALDFVMHEITWGNAAGTCKNATLARKFAEAGMQSVEFGSITAQPRAGNAGDNFYYDEKTGNSINSWGIPNAGIEAYLPELAHIRKSVNALDAQFWVSISAGDAFSAWEYEDMAAELARANAADVIEGNFSCPNMIVDGKPKPNVCYDIEAFTAGVHGLSCHARPKKAAVKLAPITEPAILMGLVDVCVKNDIDYIVVANTMGNCYLEKAPGVPAITMVRGGLAGRALRPIIKGMVQMIVPKLKGTATKLITAGGIETGLDAYEDLALGADGFQFNTILSKSNLDPKVVHDIIAGDPSREQKGLIDHLVERGLPD